MFRKPSFWSTRWDQSGLKDVIFFGCDGTYGEDFITRTGAEWLKASYCGCPGPACF